MSLLILVALFLSRADSVGLQHKWSEPLLPTDAKQCTAFSDDIGAVRAEALSASNSCSSRAKPGQRVNYTNEACLQGFDESVRASMAFTCIRDRRCEAEDTKFYELLTYSREATQSCYDKVRVYEAVEERLEEWADQRLRDLSESYRIEAEARELAEFTRKRDLELQQAIEERMAERLLANQRMAQAFQAEAMREFYRQQGANFQRYNELMETVSRQFAINQQQSVAAAAAMKNAEDTQLLLMRSTLSHWRSAYSAGCCQRGPAGESCGCK